MIDNQHFKLHVGSAGGAVLNVTSAGTGTFSIVKEFGGLLPADAAKFVTSFRVVPYVVDSLDSTMMLFGLDNLYTSTDRLETVTALPSQGNASSFSALAYGGSKNGTAYKEIFYAAAGGDVYIGGPLPAAVPGGPAPVQPITKETIDGVSSINQIVLDPRDYDIAYAVTDKGVYKRTGASTWVLISQNLPEREPSGDRLHPEGEPELRDRRHAAGRAPRRR